MPTLPLRTVLLLGVLLVAGSAPAVAQRVVYVNAAASGAGNGTSWADAYREVRTALAAALDGDELWVARATYKPTGGTDREATFTLRSGVALYGGFDGTEAARDERDWAANETVLSGNIGSQINSNDNSYHVATASGVDSTAVLDGFTVREGVANGTGGGTTNPMRFGAGLYIVGGSPSVRHSVFRDNQATFAGAGVYNGGGGRPRIETSQFMGGGLYNFQSEAVVADCVFENSAGGGVINSESVVHLEQVMFRSNLADVGGGMASTNGSVIVCVDCTFEDNTAEEGGAVYDFLSTSTFVRARFVGNTSGGGGGAAVYAEAGAIRCLDCRFEANLNGGAVFARETDLTFVNTAFLGNTTTYRGGALSVDAGSVARLYNVVLSGNRSSDPGGAIYAAFARIEAVGLTAAGNRSGSVGQHPGAVLFAEGSTESWLDNAVLWGNTGTSVVGGSVPVAVRQAIVEGGCAPPMTCDRVENVDPLFVRPPVASTPADYGDLRLLAGSPALDAGLASLLPADVWDLDGDGDTSEPLPLDLSGGPRVMGAEVDLGAYEGGVPVAAEPGPGVGEAKLDVRVSPNPASGTTAVRFSLPAAQEVTVVVYDVLGRRVHTVFEGMGQPGLNEAILLTSDLPPGVYVVRLTAGAERSASRFTVVR